MKLEPFYQLDVVLVCGLPASGKSHFSERFFHRDNRKRVNRKEIRRNLHQMFEFGEQWKEEYFDNSDEGLVKHVERRILEHLLHSGKRVLVDNTSVSVSSRKSYLAIAHQMQKSIGVIFLNTPLKRCIERNNERALHVPDVIIANLSAAAELPRADEGFDERLIINEY
ncbi:MAG: ATP-binding protein [Spirochaetaceae bacterium]|nr:MAG: ATP-binding protein [Spirochaetaceae bacterium]